MIIQENTETHKIVEKCAELSQLVCHQVPRSKGLFSVQITNEGDFLLELEDEDDTQFGSADDSRALGPCLEFILA